MQKLNGKWLVAVSAGGDSMALLSMCLEMKMDVVVAHVNYHHRKEAEEEELYIRSFCKEHCVPICVKNVPFLWHGNFEAAAREWRYDFFVSCVKEMNLKGVLVAHHEDDVIETYLMQEEKGVVPAYYGLKEDMMYHGILVKRPLLKETKKSLEGYCKKNGVRFYTDCTNADETITRNRIRHQIVDKMTPFERNMILHEIAFKNAEKQERVCRVSTYIQNEKVNIQNYRSLTDSDRLQLLRIVVEKNLPHISFAHLKEIDHIIMSKKDFVIPCGQENLVTDLTSIFLIEKEESFCDSFDSIEEMRNTESRHYRIEDGKSGVNAITLSEEDFPVCIRSVKSGDVIEMRFGTKKVHRFFIDRHIPLYQREIWPVIENRDGKVIFVSGLGCDKHHYTVNPTFNVLK